MKNGGGKSGFLDIIMLMFLRALFAIKKGGSMRDKQIKLGQTNYWLAESATCTTTQSHAAHRARVRPTRTKQTNEV